MKPKFFEKPAILTKGWKIMLVYEQVLTDFGCPLTRGKQSQLIIKLLITIMKNTFYYSFAKIAIFYLRNKHLRRFNSYRQPCLNPCQQERVPFFLVCACLLDVRELLYLVVRYLAVTPFPALAQGFPCHALKPDALRHFKDEPPRLLTTSEGFPFCRRLPLVVTGCQVPVTIV